MNIEKQLCRIAKLGIKDFETTEEVQKLQTDLLRRLERSSLDPGEYASLADCGPNYCAHKKCREVCWFGTRRRRLNEIPLIYDLLQNSHKPLHEVRLVRSTWVGPSRELPHAPIAAAKAANSRSLDKLFIPTLIAVGTFKVSVEQLYDKYLWIYEIHEIIAGAERDNLEKVLSSCRLGPAFFSNKLWVGEVTDLGQTISKVFRRDLEVWQNPEWDEPKAERLTKAQRRKFYRWLFDLSPGARLVRYGCDQHFNKLEKRPRTFHATVRKPRPYPYHLKKYMFGAREGFDDKYDPDELPGEAFKTPMVRRREREFPYLTARNKKRFFDFRARARRGGT